MRWRFLRQNWLSNRVFRSYDDIVDHCCYARIQLTDQPWTIVPIRLRDWAQVGQSQWEIALLAEARFAAQVKRQLIKVRDKL